MIVVLRVIPNGINALSKAKDLGLDGIEFTPLTPEEGYTYSFSCSGGILTKGQKITLWL